MRITNSMLMTSFLSNLRRLQTDFSKYSEQLSSGRRINRPSDNPPDLAELLALQQEVVRQTQFGNNISEAMNRLETADSKLNELTNSLLRAIQLTEQAASDTVTGTGRRAIAEEIRTIQDQILSNASTQISDRYIFAGTRTTRASLPSASPGEVYSLSTDLRVSGTGVTGGTVVDANVYEEDIYRIRFTDAAGSYEIYNYDADEVVATGTVAVGAGSISFDGLQVDYNLAALPADGEYWEVLPQYVYNGTDDEVELQVDENTNIVQNVPGSTAFGGTSGVPGGTIFDQLVELRYAMLRNDTEEIRTELTNLNSTYDGVGEVRASVGGRISNLRTYETSSNQRITDFQTRMAELENADLAEVASRLVQVEGGIQAALQTGARISTFNLFDYLG